MSGRAEIQKLLAAGFTQEEVAQWQSDETAKLRAAGFSGSEILTYWGQREPNLKPFKQAVEQNLAAAKPKEGEAQQARTLTDALEAGLQVSVSGLMGRGKKPDVVLPQDAGMAQRLAFGTTQLLGDAPAMLAGAIAGGGTPVTGTAGAFALPAAIRATLMDAYEKGDINTFGEFWERGGGIFWETAKAWMTGAATGKAGEVVGTALKTAKPVVQSTAQTAAELTTMVTVGKALEGELPKATDFADAAALVLGAKAAVKGASKLRQVYSKTGVKPEVVAEEAQRSPSVAQDLASSNIEMPRVFRSNRPAEPEMAKPDVIKTEPAPDPAAPVDPQSAVLSRISVGDQGGTRYTLDRFYTQVKDDLFPLKDMPETYMLARLTRGAFGRADQMLDYGTFNFKDYQNNGRSFKQILEPVKDDLDGIRAYAVAARSIDLTKRGLETGVPQAEAQAVVAAGRAKYEPVFRELQEYQTRLVEYLRDSGVLSKEAFDAMVQANKDYVPFFRLMDDGSQPAGAGKGMTVRNPIKGIRGSERTIIDPLESIIKNTYLYSALAERNAVGQALVKEAAGAAIPIKKKPTPVKPIEVTEKEVADILQQYGITPQQASAFTIFRGKSMTPAENEIVVFDKGVRQVYEVPKDIAAAFKATDRETVPLLLKVIAAPARALRAGSVLSPDFMLRNVARDQLSAFIFSKNGYVPILDTVRGAVSIINRDADFQNWLKSGGANATLVSLDREFIQSQLFKYDAYKEAGLFDRAWNVAKTPIEFLRITSELLENATRLGEFKKAAIGATTKLDIQAAGYASREVTLDFARIGANTRAMNMITAFWNATIEGADRTVRAFKDNPLGSTVRTVAAITLPSMLLWWANKDDPRWQEIPRWQKDLFWIVMTDDHVFRIPKPFEIGVLFGTVPERLLEKFFTDNPDAMKDFTGTLSKILGVNLIPTVAAPVIEQFANRSLFTGNPLIPFGQEKLLGEYQYNDYTTEATKALGQLIGVFPGIVQKSLDDDSMVAGGVARALTSPALMENYIRGWSGGLGIYALQIADKALREAGALPDPVKPIATLADIPVVKAFTIRYPSATAQSIQDFYDDYFAKKKVYDTWKHAAELGDQKAMERVQAVDSTMFVQLDGVQDALSTQSQLIRLINRNPDISPEEKRQLIDTVYFGMIELAKAGNKALRDAKSSFAQ